MNFGGAKATKTDGALTFVHGPEVAAGNSDARMADWR